MKRRLELDQEYSHKAAAHEKVRTATATRFPSSDEVVPMTADELRQAVKFLARRWEASTRQSNNKRKRK